MRKQCWQGLCNGQVMIKFSGSWSGYSAPRILNTLFWLGIPVLGLWLARNARPKPAVPTTLKLTITECHDGDTCKAVDEKHENHTLRFAGIDAPEIGQKPVWLSERARARMQELTIAKPCTARLLGKDVYGRDLALLWCAGIFVNETLVTEGMAYAYVNWKFADQNQAWAERAETKARYKRLGIFSLRESPMSPHQYRAGHKF